MDPDQQRWGKQYPRFPGVAECVRLILAKKARGIWAENIVHELAENAEACLPELIAAYRDTSSDDVTKYVMMALDIARPPAAIPFLSEVLRDGNETDRYYARTALNGINTREARIALRNAEQA
jgi:hypothetical protein